MFGSFIVLTSGKPTFPSIPATGRVRACLIVFAILAVLAAFGIMLATIGTGQVHATIPLAGGQAWG
jgi:hypothetical protein